MKYSARIKQAQLAGGVMIKPEGGELTAAQVEAVKGDPWGKELIRSGVLHIEGVKPSDIVDEPKKGAKGSAPKTGGKSLSVDMDKIPAGGDKADGQKQ
jgi:hypothetical protein